MFGSRDPAGKYTQIPLNDRGDDSSDDEADDFIQRQIRTQRAQLKKQDEGLEMLGQSAQRLGQLSMNISEELTSQNKMIDEMEEDLDHATTMMQTVTLRTRELVKQSGGKQNFAIILTLMLIVIILIFLIICT